MNASPTKQKTPWLLAGVVLLVAIVAAFIVWQLNQREPQPQEIATPPVVSAPAEPSSEPAAAEPEPEPMEVSEAPAAAQATADIAEVVEEPPTPAADAADQPTLNNSDAQLTASLDRAGAGELNQWLVQEHTLRKLVRAINALEEGKLVAQHRPVVQPPTGFKAERDGEQWRLSEANFARYEPYIATLEQVGPERLKILYQQYSPLLEQAYQELGVEKGSFEQVARGALQQIINAPRVEQPVELDSTSVTYHYTDERLEKLPELHKLMIRMGPENRERLRELAQELLQELK